MYSKAQQERLAEKPQFRALTMLHDGDLLIVDQVNRRTEILAHPHPESIPYILTKDGKIQEIDYHFRYYHLADIPAYGDEDTLPSLNGPHYPRNHN